MEYTTVDRIFARIHRDLDRSDISKQHIVEWIGEALEFIGSSCIYQPAVAFVTIENHQCQMPKNLHVILQIARNNNYQDPVTALEILEATEEEEGADIPVALDQTGMPVNAYELAYYRPYFDIIGEYYIGGLYSYIERQFTPVRLANHIFFNTIVCKQTDFENIYSSCQDEYTIAENMLRFSFETGQVAISYLKYKIDCETGYPYIPDEISHITAITKYVIMKIAERDFYKHREGSQTQVVKAESDWHWYCKQAQNRGMMPQTIDQWENLLRQRNYLIPQTNRYETFFGELSHAENRNMIT